MYVTLNIDSGYIVDTIPTVWNWGIDEKVHNYIGILRDGKEPRWCRQCIDEDRLFDASPISKGDVVVLGYKSYDENVRKRTKYANVIECNGGYLTLQITDSRNVAMVRRQEPKVTTRALKRLLASAGVNHRRLVRKGTHRVCGFEFPDTGRIIITQPSFLGAMMQFKGTGFEYREKGSFGNLNEVLEFARGFDDWRNILGRRIRA